MEENKLVFEQPNYEKLLEEIRTLNADLGHLVSQPTSPVVIKSNRSAAIERYNRVRKNAKTLHDVFLESFRLPYAIAGRHIMLVSRYKRPRKKPRFIGTAG